MKSKPNLVAVAMSGGVDSSVCAVRLLEQGCRVFGITARMRPPGTQPEAEADIEAARAVARHLGISHHVVDLSEPFESRVLEYFAATYHAGRTPSPCVVCNRYIKFGALLQMARELGADRLATGHYARIECDGRRRHLLRGRDRRKDQSYFLFDLSQRQLAQALFPLGELTKDEVRCEAVRKGLPVTPRGESQDLCFAGQEQHWRITEARRPRARRPGVVVDRAGRTLGTHDGIHRFTIGQRRGLGVADGRRLYVVALRPRANEVVLGERDQLYRRELQVRQLRWISGSPRKAPFRAAVKLRYNHEAAPAQVTPLGAHVAKIHFDLPQFAVTPGQAAVCYEGDRVVAGGWIRLDPALFG